MEQLRAVEYRARQVAAQQLAAASDKGEKDGD